MAKTYSQWQILYSCLESILIYIFMMFNKGLAEKPERLEPGQLYADVLNPRPAPIFFRNGISVSGRPP